MENKAVCETCSSTEDLKASRRAGGKIYCWPCRFRFDREREPTQIDIDHHNGILHVADVKCKECDHRNGIKHTDACRLCTPQDYLSDKLENPKKYLTYSGEWPGGYSGNLLAWLSMNLSCKDIAHVEVNGYLGLTYYQFEPKDFDIPFDGSGGDIKELEDNIVRFVMKDGSCYKVEVTDYKYKSTSLNYIPPIVVAKSLRTGLGKILKHK